MASDRASPTDTAIGTAVSGSDTGSSETMVLKNITTEQVAKISGDKEPTVKLSSRPSTAPPASQTQIIMSSKLLLDDDIPSQAMAASVEPGSDAKAEVKGVKKHGNEIFLDETIALTNLRPVYPVSRRALQELNKGPKISAFVGTGEEREYIFEVPKAILAYFSPTLRPLLHSSTPKSYLLLEKADKKALSWLLRWMLNGGVEKSYDDAPPEMDSAVDWAIHRLALVTGFGVQGCLHERLMKEVGKLTLQGKIKAKDLRWVYRNRMPLPVRQLGNEFAHFVVDSVLDGTMTVGIEGARQNDLLKAAIVEALERKKGKLHVMQRVHRQPVTLFQVNFIYAFTLEGSELRKAITKNLLWLIDTQGVANGPYQAHARHNAEFRADMTNAIDDAKARNAQYYRDRRDAGNFPPQGRRVSSSVAPKAGPAGINVGAGTVAYAATAGAAAPTATAGTSAPARPFSSHPAKNTRPRQRAPRGPKHHAGDIHPSANTQTDSIATNPNVPTGPKAGKNPRAPRSPKARQTPRNQTQRPWNIGLGQLGPGRQPGSNAPLPPLAPSRTGIIRAVSPELAVDADTSAPALVPAVQTFGTRIASEVVLRITKDGGIEREERSTVKD